MIISNEHKDALMKDYKDKMNKENKLPITTSDEHGVYTNYKKEIKPLSEKRKEWFLKLCNKKPDDTWIIQVIEEEVEKQDKEFIKEVKEKLGFINGVDEEIDKIVGKELI